MAQVVTSSHYLNYFYLTFKVLLYFDLALVMLELPGWYS